MMITDNPIRLSGFTFIRGGVTLGYPYQEAIECLLNLCDEVIVNVGFSDQALIEDDGTWNSLEKRYTDNPKIKLIKSFWDAEMASQGLILSHQTNIALNACRGKYCQYLQADESLHEEDFSLILKSLDFLDANPQLQGVTFNYIHFYGSPLIQKYTRNAYRREVRLIRNNEGTKSYLDAQGFRSCEGKKLKVLQGQARVFHYGWARKQDLMNLKVKNFAKLYHGKDFENSDFTFRREWGLQPFLASHPKFIKSWLDKFTSAIELKDLKPLFKWQDLGLAFSDAIEKMTGYRMGEYRNYKVIKKMGKS